MENELVPENLIIASINGSSDLIKKIIENEKFVDIFILLNNLHV